MLEYSDKLKLKARKMKWKIKLKQMWFTADSLQSCGLKKVEGVGLGSCNFLTDSCCKFLTGDYGCSQFIFCPSIPPTANSILCPVLWLLNPIIAVALYTVSQKRDLYTFAHNFGRCWRIFEIFPFFCKFLDEFNNGKISQIRQHLPELWAKVWRSLFDSQCTLMLRHVVHSGGGRWRWMIQGWRWSRCY